MRLKLLSTQPYSATGTKLQQRTYGMGNLLKTTDYVGPFVYETPTTQTTPKVPAFVQTSEGRALFTPGTTAPSFRWKYEYFIKDHLGNVRFAFREPNGTTAQRTASAGMEPVNATQEEREFQHVGETRFRDALHARTGDYVAKLNAREGRAQGPTLTLAVAAGDSITAEVYGRYDRGQLTPNTFRTGALVAGAIVGSVPATGATDQNVPLASRRRLLPYVGASLAIIPQLLGLRRAEIPQAYLRYELFNRDSQMVATRTSALMRTATDSWQHLSAGLKADSAGYVRVILVNQSALPAYFDDLALSRPVEPYKYQENHYDPFGLNLVGIEHDGDPNNRFQYNGKEKQEAFGLNWLDYGARMYDAQLGRWNSADPLAEKYSYITPYAYGNNNPVRYMDPDGREIVDSKGKAVTINKDGGFVYAGKDASIIQYVGELSKNAVGRETLTGLVNISTKVSVEITTDRAIGKDADGNVKALEGQTIGKGSIVDPKTGKTVYKTAEITIYTGEYDAEVAEGSGQYSKSSLGKFINGVGTHEGTHPLDDLKHDKNLTKESGATGKDLQKLKEKTHEDRPNEQERNANANYPAQ